MVKPVTPPRIPIEEYQQYSHSNGAGLWRTVAVGLAGLLIGLIAAYFTALTQKGVTDAQMKEYVKEYSPYVSDKALLAEHNQSQDRQIGELNGGDERIRARLIELENYNVKDTLEKQSMKDKEKQLGDTLDIMMKGRK